MAKKIEAAPVAVPQSYEAANALVERYGELLRQIDTKDTELSGEVAVITKRAKDEIRPLALELAGVVAKIAAYAAAHRNTLTTDGKVKFHDMPAGRIGWRNDPPSVEVKKGTKLETVVATLREMRLGKFLRRGAWTLNKDAMLDDQEKAKTVPGIRIKTGAEQFYIAPISAKPTEAAP